MYSLTKGTVEHIVLEVTDHLDGISTLVGSNLTYDVMERDGTPVTGMQALIGTTVDMKALCLIDTTALDEGKYKLFIKFNALPEIPRLGPFDFYVNAD